MVWHASALSRGSLDDVVDTHDHLGGLSSGSQHLSLHPVRLDDTQLRHVLDLAVDHVQSVVVEALGVFRSQLGDQIGTVEAAVVSDDIRQRPQSATERLNGDSFLTGSSLGQLKRCVQ